jgi:hypothetical protein
MYGQGFIPFRRGEKKRLNKKMETYNDPEGSVLLYMYTTQKKEGSLR